jgi:hypothetical protein
VSDVVCPQPSPVRARVVHAFVSVSASEGGATVALHRIDLCRRDRPWDRDSAAAAFETDALQRLGHWTRQP